MTTAYGGWSVPAGTGYPLTKNPGMVVKLPPVIATRSAPGLGFGPSAVITDPGALYKPTGRTFTHYNGIEVGDTVILNEVPDSPEGTVLNIYEARPNVTIPVVSRGAETARVTSVWMHVEWWEPKGGWTPLVPEPPAEMRPKGLVVIFDHDPDSDG